MALPLIYTIEDLGPEVGFLDPSVPIMCSVGSVNDHGDVVGFAWVTEPSAPSGQTPHAFRVHGTTVEDIHPIAARWTHAADINASGFIVGTIGLAGGVHAFVRDPAGSMSLLKTPVVGGSGGANAISHAGAVTGSWNLPPGSGRAVRWGPPIPTSVTDPVDLHDDALHSSEGEAINDAAQVAGRIKRVPGLTAFNALHDSGRWVVIEPYEAETAPAITASGDVAGTFMKRPPCGFVYQAGVLTVVDGTSWPGNPGWGGATSIHDVSDGGEAVGQALSPVPWSVGHYPFVATLWDHVSGTRDLNQFIAPNSGWFLGNADAISPNGAYVVGRGTLNGESRIFRITRTSVGAIHMPVPRDVDIPRTWPWTLLGGLLDEGGIAIGPRGPVPVPPWGDRPAAPAGLALAEVLKTLAVHALVDRLSDPALRRAIQPLLLHNAIEALRGIEAVVASAGEIRTLKRIRRPSVIVGRSAPARGSPNARKSPKRK